MNKFEAIIRHHWQTYLPNAWSQLSDPETMVRESASELEREVQQLAEAIAGRDQPGTGYVEKVARLMSARQDAESDLLREFLPPPEEELEAQENEDLQRELAQLQDNHEWRMDQLRTQAEEEAFQREDLTESQQKLESDRVFAFLVEQDALRAAHEETLNRHR